MYYIAGENYVTMARIFITGSADGLGQMSASLLIAEGHQVVLHARSAARGKDAMKKNPGAETVLSADLSDIEETKKLAEQVNTLGSFDAVIHNAGVYRDTAKQIFAVNTLAPYILTCLIKMPKRLVYLSSGMHLHGRPNLENFKQHVDRISYSDSKLHVVMLALSVARKWPDVYSNAVDPGWVPTKMGGRGAPDDLQKGYETQAWLATSEEKKAKVRGRYFFHKKERTHNAVADNIKLQDEFLMICAQITGVPLPPS
jgi:NAD(P)-dependent dehydrogenase (short-subunit alcohol dehydrogenase family)